MNTSGIDPKTINELKEILTVLTTMVAVKDFPAKDFINELKELNAIYEKLTQKFDNYSPLRDLPNFLKQLYDKKLCEQLRDEIFKAMHNATLSIYFLTKKYEQGKFFPSK